VTSRGSPVLKMSGPRWVWTVRARPGCPTEGPTISGLHAARLVAGGLGEWTGTRRLVREPVRLAGVDPDAGATFKLANVSPSATGRVPVSRAVRTAFWRPPIP